MNNIFNNTWFVSIIGGVISGILVYLFTGFVLNKKDKKEYKKRVENANIAVQNYLRGHVLENGIPTDEMFESVKVTTAREYRIKADEFLSNKQICQKYVQEIIGNIYISNDSKVKYLSMLQKYLESYQENEKAHVQQSVINNNYERVSAIASLIAAIGTLVASMLSYVLNV